MVLLTVLICTWFSYYNISATYFIKTTQAPVSTKRLQNQDQDQAQVKTDFNNDFFKNPHYFFEYRLLVLHGNIDQKLVMSLHCEIQVD